MIQNDQQIKMMILYTVWSAGCPLPTQTLEVILAECGIGQIGTSGELHDLAEKGHLSLISDEETEYAVLQKTGIEIVSTLGADLSPTIREKLILTTAREVAKLRKDLGIATSVDEKSEGGFEVKLSITDDGISLIEIKMFAPTKVQADIMTANFKEDHYRVYREVLASMTKPRR